MSDAAHPFEIGKHITTLTELARRQRASRTGVVARLGDINLAYRDDDRFAAAWPVVRVAAGELVYFDRTFHELACREVGLRLIADHE